MQKFINALPDALIVAGVAAVSFGAWLLLPAAGFITGGVLLIAFGVLAAMSRPAKAAE